MATPQEEIEQLKARISRMEADFSEEVRLLYKYVARLEAGLKETEEKPLVYKPLENQIVKPERIRPIPEPVAVSRDSEKGDWEEAAKRFEEEKAARQRAQEIRERQAESRRIKEQEKADARAEMMSGALEFFAPLVELRGMAAEAYSHYKAQNRLPVFFMSLGGIAAILLAFSYLMQYVSDFSFEVLKLTGSVLSSAAILFFGFNLSKKAEKYKDFASALLGLSIVLNYLIFYYLSDSDFFPVFRNEILSFALIFLNTAFAIWLAFRFETRIILVISLLGGAFSPFYLGTSAVSLFYYPYLWVLSASSLFIAGRIKWNTGGFLTFVTASVALESAYLNGNSPSVPVFTLIFSAFAYLFFYVSLFEGKKTRTLLNPLLISILAGNIAFYSANIYYLFDAAQMRTALGICYLVNAAVFLIGFFVFRPVLNDKTKVLFFILAGTFAALSAPVLVNRNLEGVFWAVEGLALLFCGFNFGLSGVRKEAYAVLLLALGQIAFTFQGLFAEWHINLWTDGFINLLVLGVIAAGLWFMLHFYRTIRTKYEDRIFYGVSEFLPIWTTVILTLFAHFYLRERSFNFSILALYALIWWGLRKKLILTEWFGIAQLVLLIVAISFSVSAVGTFRFASQTLPGKFAYAEVFLSLWFLQLFYEKISPESPQILLTKLFRELFYLLVPLLHLSYTNRNFPDYFAAALWLTVLAGFILNQFVKRKALLTEIHLAVLLATNFSVRFMLDNPEQAGISYLTAGSGLLVLFGILFFKKGFSEEIAAKSDYKYLFSYAFYFLGLCIFLGAFTFSGQNLVTALVLTAGYFLLITFFRSRLAPLQTNYQLAYRLGFVSLVAAIIFYDISSVSVLRELNAAFFIFVFALYGLIVYEKNTVYPFKNTSTKLFDLYAFHVLMSVFYAGLFGLFFPAWLGVWLTVVLVLHAIILLFNSTKEGYKPLIKLTIAYFVFSVGKLFLYDLAGFSTVQKVIVFMVIGVLMLGGSFLFMKFREQKGEDEN